MFSWSMFRWWRRNAMRSADLRSTETIKMQRWVICRCTLETLASLSQRPRSHFSLGGASVRDHPFSRRQSFSGGVRTVAYAKHPSTPWCCPRHLVLPDANVPTEAKAGLLRLLRLLLCGLLHANLVVFSALSPFKSFPRTPFARLHVCRCIFIHIIYLY